MNVTTNNDKTKMTYENYIKQPRETVGIKLKMFIAKNPHLINSPDKSNSHPLFKKYSIILFNDQIIYLSSL